MAFADIKYFGDSGGSFKGAASWSGRVSNVSDLDRVDWGAGRKTPTSDVKRTLKKLVEQAVKKESRSSSSVLGSGKRALEKMLSGAERSGNTTVGVKQGTDIAADVATFSVEGPFRTSAVMPFATRLATNEETGKTSLFVRSVGITSVGRVCNVGPEQEVPLKIEGSGSAVSPLYFEYDDTTNAITNCMVFLGCFGIIVECADYEVGDNPDGTYYAIVDFSGDEPVLSVSETNAAPVDGISFMACVISGGKQTKGVSGPVILPTYS